MSDVYIDVTEDDFDSKIVKSPKPVLVDFWAPWSGPCQTMAPIISNLQLRYGEKIAFAKCNVDEHPALADRFSLKSIPTIMIFNHGAPVEVITGLTSPKKVSESIEKAIAS